MKRDGRVDTLARNMRRRMTRYEYRLYAGFLYQLPVRVYKQYVIGSYIADFYIPQYKLVIELDGSGHFTEKGIAKDLEKTQFFESKGYKVCRYSNSDVYNNFSGVCEDIMLNMGMEF